MSMRTSKEKGYFMWIPSFPAEVPVVPTLRYIAYILLDKKTDALIM